MIQTLTAKTASSLMTRQFHLSIGFRMDPPGIVTRQLNENKKQKKYKKNYTSSKTP